jgi:uncharacterized protein YijF (DUF1287 family)
MRYWLPAAVMTGLLCLPASAAGPRATAFVAAADALQNPGITYDSSYHRISYPMGDVPKGTGVCADVIVRAYRAVGIDLQKLVHQDMVKHFAAYPSRWRMRGPDKNIDHRRVPNLAKFFSRHGTVLKISSDTKDYAPGDIVTWNLRPGGTLPHIGIVTDRRAPTGRPLVMHNIGGGQVMEDVLFAYPITGHFRYALD